MSTWKPVVGVVLVFVLGILVGLLPGFYFMHRFPPPPPPPAMDRAHRDAIMTERLSKDLALTEGQKTKVAPIVKQMNERLDQHLRTVQPEVQKIFDESFAQIEKELNDAQRKRFAALRDRMEHHKGPRPPFP
jgi:hypothetical protein